MHTQKICQLMSNAFTAQQTYNFLIFIFRLIFFQFDFMGNVELNDLLPFPIRYKYDKPEIAFHAETKKCNESYPVKIWTCHLLKRIPYK